MSGEGLLSGLLVSSLVPLTHSNLFATALQCQLHPSKLNKNLNFWIAKNQNQNVCFTLGAIFFTISWKTSLSPWDRPWTREELYFVSFTDAWVYAHVHDEAYTVHEVSRLSRPGAHIIMSPTQHVLHLYNRKTNCKAKRRNSTWFKRRTSSRTPVPWILMAAWNLICHIISPRWSMGPQGHAGAHTLKNVQSLLGRAA